MEDRPAPPDSAVIQAALAAMLAQHPNALVAAIDDAGLFVPIPSGIELIQHRVSRARSALDLVQPPAREAVIRAWEGVNATGAARAVVAIAGDQPGRAALHFFDVRPTYGVFMGVMIAIDVAPEQLDHVASIPPSAPRLVRTRKNEVAVIVDADTDLTAMLGWSHAEFIGKRSLDFIHPDDQDAAINAWMEVIGKPGSTCRARLRHRHRDGRWIWLDIANRNLLDQPDGCVDCEMIDISEEMDAQEAVRASEQLLRRLAEALPVGVAQFDVDRRLLYANDRLRDILGAGPDDDEDAMTSAVADSEQLDAAINTVLGGEDVDLELRVNRLDGSGRALCTLALRALTTPDGTVSGAVGCLTDITDSSRMRAELEQRATFDGLTGCVNRTTTMATLDEVLDGSGANTAVVFVDLDDFKNVNDQFGHVVGDTLLVAIAARIRDAVRAGDVVGRVGGDEFLVVCAEVTDAEAALTLGERIADALVQPLDVDVARLHPKASIGVAWAGEHALGADAEMLIAEADAAMYTSKSAGEGRPVLACNPDRPQLARTVRAADLGPQLRQAITRRELEIHYQPIVTLDGSTTIGYEALLRWHRNGRIVPAAEFIVAAETTGLICELGPWVVDEVCRQAFASRRPDLTWFVNLSPRELAAPRTVASFGSALDRHGIAPSSLVVEVTEHAAFVDGGIASGVVAELTRLGIGLALDDFGTGHSSLSTLLELPADWIKIDRRFTAGTAAERGRRLVAGIVDLARRIGANTIAEGVETREELVSVTALGVGYGQGYLFGRPAALGIDEDDVAARMARPAG